MTQNTAHYQTRDQRLATAVYSKVLAIQATYNKHHTNQMHGDTSQSGSTNPQLDQYGSMAHRLPILIHKAGLAQALAFVEARGKEPHKDLLNHLAQVILGEDHNGSELARKSRSSDLREYLLLTQNVLDGLLWFKRFAQSILGVTADNQKGHDE